MARPGSGRGARSRGEAGGFERSWLGGRVLAKVGDITREAADAVVNAANSTLLGGGGVDGAIHRAGGPRVLEECKRLREERFPDGLPTGQAAATAGGDLPARFVIHVVGPVWGGRPQDEELLAACYANALRVAEELGCRTVAFPAISTGAYRFPREQAARVASRAIAEHLAAHPGIEQVRLVFMSEEDARVFSGSARFESA